MKAITVRQPWASLIAAGVKTIDTRPRSTSYRGRIAIHAAVARPPVVDFGRWSVPPVEDVLCEWTERDGRPAVTRKVALPLGAVVASAVLTDCVPIVGPHDMVRAPYIRPMTNKMGLRRGDATDGVPFPEDITDQLPYGDFSPGRWALLLDDIKPTTERCPACWGAALTGLCGRTDLGSDGPCVMRSGHADRGTPCWGENDVAGDWTPAASCRTCCVCPCGSTDDGTECPYCHTTRTPGRCDPVPARGQQAVPWEWTA